MKIRPYNSQNVIIIIFLFFSFLSNKVSAQLLIPPPDVLESAPQWAKSMYSENPNVYTVERQYNDYYRKYDFQKNMHTRNYRFWRKAVQYRIDADGYILPSSSLAQLPTNKTSDQQKSSNGSWSLVGPIQNYGLDSTLSAYQVNVYCIDQSLSDSSIVFCGTESGEIYKSVDHGENWSNVSLDLIFPGAYWNLGIRAIAIHPTNPDIVYFSADKYIVKTTNGGVSWNIIYTSPFIDGWGFNAETIIISTSSPNTVFVASRGGLFKSTNGGTTWNQVINGVVYDVKFNSASDSIIYALRKSVSLTTIEFFRSTDFGSSFTNITNGWYSSTDINRTVTGGRIAVSKADPSRVYANLYGNSKAGDYGYIGLYRSDNSGILWTLPNGPNGGPYNTIHPNLGTGNIDGTGVMATLYNCALLLSDLNPDQLLIGGINLWKSDDGGYTFTPLGGIINGPFNGVIHYERFHVDMQDFRQVENTTWITTDGGIYRSFDFFSTTNFEKTNRGIHSTEFRGFGSGWNEDVLFGGAYHNGNMAFYENWGTGNSLNLAGGEPSSGYVNPGDNRMVYSSGPGGRYLPFQIGGPVGTFGFGIDPNENHHPILASSELEFDPRCYSIAYTGKDNQLWKTRDKGSTFYLLSTFGNDPNDFISFIEVSRTDPNIIYVCQQLSSANSSALFKTIDGGISWSQITLPSVNFDKNTILQVDSYDPMQIWVAFSFSGNPSKIFKSSNGGTSWTDLTTPTISSDFVQTLNLIGGTDGGVYMCTRIGVFYRNNTMNDWISFSDGLPAKIDTRFARPFYRDGKLRIATDKGIWESDFSEPQTEPLAQIMSDKLVGVNSFCQGADTIHFVDHSMLDHNNASWNWTFQGGTPSTANTWHADVTFNFTGTHLVTLQITDGNGNVDSDSLYITITDEAVISNTHEEDFENAFPPLGFAFDNIDGNNISWQLNDSIGGFGMSSRCMFIPSYYSSEGAIDDAILPLDLTNFQNSELTFDVAYAIWGGGYIDTLEVLISTDCGLTYDTLYSKGGVDLATAPANSTDPFVPQPSEWRTDTVDLSSYDGIDNIKLVFRAIQGWAQHMYIDNINVDGAILTDLDEQTKPQQQLLIYPNPVLTGNNLYLYADGNEQITVELYNMLGQKIYSSSHEPLSSISTSGLSSGTYAYWLSTSKLIKQGLIIIK